MSLFFAVFDKHFVTLFLKSKINTHICVTWRAMGIITSTIYLPFKNSVYHLIQDVQFGLLVVQYTGCMIVQHTEG